MGDVLYQGGMKALKEGLLDGSPDLRLMLVMSAFTGVDTGTEQDAINMADFATLDEFDGIGYQEIDEAITFAYDAPAHEFQLHLDPAYFNADGAAGTVAPASDDAIGILVKLYVDGTLANDIAVGFTDGGGFPANAANGSMLYTPHTDGMMFLEPGT